MTNYITHLTQKKKTTRKHLIITELVIDICLFESCPIGIVCIARLRLSSVISNKATLIISLTCQRLVEVFRKLCS